MSSYLDLDALWRVAAFAAAFAVGVVVLYSLGMVTMARSADARSGRARLGSRTASGLCLLICAAAVAFGIWVMLAK